MKKGKLGVVAGVLVLGIAMCIIPNEVQGQPAYDQVNVDLPYSVMIGNQTLQPGKYEIRQMSGVSGKVLLIYSDNGMRYESSAITIPALETNGKTQADTRVVLHHLGQDYYFDKVWIAGKQYGYQFPLPDSVKAREREMQPVSVAATYETAPAEASAATPAPAVQQPAPAPAAPPRTMAPQPPAAAPPVVAQTTPPPAAAGQGEANRQMPETPEMPATSSGWMVMLLGGGVIAAAGLLLRRKAKA